MQHLTDQFLLDRWLTLPTTDVRWWAYTVELSHRGVISEIRGHERRA